MLLFILCMRPITHFKVIFYQMKISRISLIFNRIRYCSRNTFSWKKEKYHSFSEFCFIRNNTFFEPSPAISSPQLQFSYSSHNSQHPGLLYTKSASVKPQNFSPFQLAPNHHSSKSTIACSNTSVSFIHVIVMPSPRFFFYPPSNLSAVFLHLAISSLLLTRPSTGSFSRLSRRYLLLAPSLHSAQGLTIEKLKLSRHTPTSPISPPSRRPCFFVTRIEMHSIDIITSSAGWRHRYTGGAAVASYPSFCCSLPCNTQWRQFGDVENGHAAQPKNKERFKEMMDLKCQWSGGEGRPWISRFCLWQCRKGISNGWTGRTSHLLRSWIACISSLAAKRHVTTKFTWH